MPTVIRLSKDENVLPLVLLTSLVYNRDLSFVSVSKHSCKPIWDVFMTILIGSQSGWSVATSSPAASTSAVQLVCSLWCYGIFLTGVLNVLCISCLAIPLMCTDTIAGDGAPVALLLPEHPSCNLSDPLSNLTEEAPLLNSYLLPQMKRDWLVPPNSWRAVSHHLAEAQEQKGGFHHQNMLE